MVGSRWRHHAGSPPARWRQPAAQSLTLYVSTSSSARRSTPSSNRQTGQIIIPPNPLHDLPAPPRSIKPGYRAAKQGDGSRTLEASRATFCATKPASHATDCKVSRLDIVWVGMQCAASASWVNQMLLQRSEHSTGPATLGEWAKLDLDAPNSRVLRVTRIQLESANHPLAVEEVVLALERLPGFVPAGDIPDIMELAQRQGLALGRATERVSIVK